MPWVAIVHLLDRYLARIGSDGRDLSLDAIHRAHVTSIPFENVDVLVGQEVRLDLDSLVDKLVVRRRGGYCFEQNTLFAAVLEELGLDVTRCLGRVRLGFGEGPRPATHMCLLVDGRLLDVGFGAATPIGPIPLGGGATYGGLTWRTERVTSPEGKDAWLLSMADMPLYTFTERDCHPVDFLAPAHFTSTHPGSVYRKTLIVQRWREDLVQVGLVGLDLLRRDPHTQVRVAPADLCQTLLDVFGLALTSEQIEHLLARAGPGGSA